MNARSFTTVSATTIKAVVGNGNQGSVSVTTPGGTASMNGFTFITPQPPTITSFTPGKGSVGAMITITGSRFTGATAVTFGGVAARSYTVVSSTIIIPKVGEGASGDVKVTTAGGVVSLG